MGQCFPGMEQNTQLPGISLYLLLILEIHLNASNRTLPQEVNEEQILIIHALKQ